MPVISEDEVATSSSPTKIPGLKRMPPVALRIPQKNPRRGSPVSSLGKGLPPPYIPPYVLEQSTTQQQQQQQNPPPTYQEESWKSEGDGPESQASEKVVSRRRLADRWCCILGTIVAILVTIAIGLAIGLTVGLKDHSHHGNSSGNDSDQSFPAGSFSFKADLQETSTNCTSNPSTWRCFPYNIGDAATFYWVITANGSTNSSSPFTISSSDNPFAPSFSNVPLKLLDKGEPTERLHFSFTMTKKVVPSGSLSPSNRAAECSFSGTVFEATMWTRQKGKSNVGEPDPGDTIYGPWPRNVEIVQSKESQLGQPQCEDSDGNVIADVQAESGTCSCRYSNVDG
ncbi:hypothetical protein BGZ63DRAFT_427359 [Mariannaea sp. PMI_226]|nr:hypothetical protein BGZ63DRAFT_427359 [Mariannaea sp. PMI_226]